MNKTTYKTLAEEDLRPGIKVRLKIVNGKTGRRFPLLRVVRHTSCLSDWSLIDKDYLLSTLHRAALHEYQIKVEENQHE